MQLAAQVAKARKQMLALFDELETLDEDDDPQRADEIAAEMQDIIDELF